MNCTTCNIFAEQLRVCTSLFTLCGDKHFTRLLTFPILLGERPSRRWHSCVMDSVSAGGKCTLEAAPEHLQHPQLLISALNSAQSSWNHC